MKVEKSAHANESSAEMIKTGLFCGFDDFSDDQYAAIDYVMQIVSMLGCFVTIMVAIVMSVNIIETFIYQRIFSFMKT